MTFFPKIKLHNNVGFLKVYISGLSCIIYKGGMFVGVGMGSKKATRDQTKTRHHYFMNLLTVGLCCVGRWDNLVAA